VTGGDNTNNNNNSNNNNNNNRRTSTASDYIIFQRPTSNPSNGWDFCSSRH